MKVALAAAFSLITANAQIISTVAGADWIYPSGVTAALSAPLGGITGLALDSAGNVFASDYDNCNVVKVSQSGGIIVVAGTGVCGLGGDGGPANRARMLSPGGLAVDAAGNLYIADSLNGRIRKVDSAGTISTFAGKGNAISVAAEGVPAISVFLGLPNSLALDKAGNLYFTENSAHRVRRVGVDGMITTVAGTGTPGNSGDGGPAISAALKFPTGLVFDSRGNLFIADSNNYVIRKVDAAGVITTVAGTGLNSSPQTGVQATASPIGYVQGLAVDSADNLYIASESDYLLRVDSKTSRLTIIAGNGDIGLSGDGGLAVSAAIGRPYAVAVHGDGSIYLGERGNYGTVRQSNVFLDLGFANRIRRIDPAGVIRTFAGNGAYRFAGDTGPAVAAALNGPAGLVLDREGSLWIADSFNGRVRRVTSNGQITTMAGDGNQSFAALAGAGQGTNTSLFFPWDVIVDPAGGILVAEDYRVRRLTADGILTPLIGDGRARDAGDNGPAARASVFFVSGLSMDPTGNTYLVDSLSCRVRVVTPDGVIRAFAGNGTQAFSGDGGPAVSAALNAPAAAVADSQGGLYIADARNNRIRKVTADGMITTLAGDGTGRFSGDGGPAIKASLNKPNAILLDAMGNLFIADSGNNRIRKISPDGVITTIAGTGTAGFSGDGGAPLAAQLNNPAGLAFDAAGNIYFSDTGNHRIRKITFPPVFSAESVVTAGGFTSGALVPGSITSIFGSGFAAAATFPDGYPVTTLAGLQVFVDGIPAPIFYADTGQINIQIPAEISVGKNVPVLIINGGVKSATVMLPSAASRPAIFTLGEASAIRAPSSLQAPQLLPCPSLQGSHPVRRQREISSRFTVQALARRIPPSPRVPPHLPPRLRE